MRSSLIIASLALSILAAPVPVAEQAPARRDVEDSAAPVEALMAKRFQRTGDGGIIGSRDVPSVGEELESLEKRGGRSKAEKRGGRSKAQRSLEVDDEEDLEKRGGRSKAQRSVEADDEEDLEKRGGRSKAEKRGGRSKAQRSLEADDEEDLEKRGGRGKAQRSAEANEEEDLEKRGGRGKAERSVEANEQDLEERTTRLKNGGKPSNTVRNIYDGVVGIVEALKTRGFSSANYTPVRQPM